MPRKLPRPQTASHPGRPPSHKLSADVPRPFPPLSPHSRTVCFHPFPAPFLPRIQTRNESLPSLPKQVRSRRTGYFLSRRKPLRLAGVARRRLPHTLLQANRPMARDKAPSGLLFFPLPFRRNQPKIRVFRDPIPAYASGTAPKSVAPTAVDPKTSPPPARSAAELSTAVFGCPTLTRESDRPAAETTDFAGTAVIRAPDRPGPVAELARSIPATFRDRTEAYSHPSSPAPPEEPVPRAGHRTTHLRKTSAGTGPKTVHQSRFTRQPQSRPRKTARRTCSQSRTQPPQKSSPAPPAEPTKQIRNESVEHAASVQTKCVQAKGNAQKEMRKAKRNTPKRKATPQNASFRPAICRPETSANAAPGPCGGGGARRATPASSRRRCPYPYRWTAALRCGRRSPAVCRPVRAAFCPEARNSPRRGRPSSPAYCPAARSP